MTWALFRQTIEFRPIIGGPHAKEYPMNQENRELVIVMTRGADHELSSVAFTIACGGGTIIACPPCVKARGYTPEDFIEGVTIAGASAIHERLKAGAASLSF